MSLRGSYKLADFGTATVLEAAPLRRDECGTLWIMAPELLGRRPHGLNCDVWPGAPLELLIPIIISCRYINIKI